MAATLTNSAASHRRDGFIPSPPAYRSAIAREATTSRNSALAAPMKITSASGRRTARYAAAEPAGITHDITPTHFRHAARPAGTTRNSRKTSAHSLYSPAVLANIVANSTLSANTMNTGAEPRPST